MNNNKKVIIDTDPGIDDAMAILLALKSSEIKLMGLTTIFGNVSCSQSTLNALRILEEGDYSVPVAKGCDNPLFSQLNKYASFVHGNDGLGDANLSIPVGKPIELSAAQFIVNTVRENPGEISLVAIGPLTNIAIAIKMAPDIIDLLKEIIIMGGAVSVPGNVSPVAESNIWKDPHAASVVFNSKIKLTMIGLDVTTKTLQSKEYHDEIFTANNSATNFLKKILPYYQKAYFNILGSNHIYTHDPSTIAYLLKPELFTTQLIPIFIETEGHCRGQTVPDYKKQWENLPLITVCTGVNTLEVLNLIKFRLMS